MPHTKCTESKQNPKSFKTRISQLLCYQQEIFHSSDITSPEQHEIFQGLHMMKLYFLKRENKKAEHLSTGFELLILISLIAEFRLFFIVISHRKQEKQAKISYLKLSVTDL